MEYMNIPGTDVSASRIAQLDDVFGWSLDGEAHRQIDAILRDAVRDPVGPEFMAPPAGRVAEEPQRLRA